MTERIQVEKRVAEFLIQSRIAVAGVSRSNSKPGNVIFRRLKECGVEVYAINPQADEIAGVKCFSDLKSVPVKLDAVVVATSPRNSESIVRECAELGISRVWLHRSFGAGSVSEKAVQFCLANKIQVIEGGCPMMFCPPVDLAHKCMGWFMLRMGKMRAR